MTEFTALGLHCAAESCNQQDFLPFTCDCCNGTYCLSHRSYATHSCPLAGDRDFRALVCPLCKETVRFVDSQDPNERWELHSRTECDPGGSNGKRSPKSRCPASGCREVLRPTNTQRCARCAKETCLAHRFPDSHGCAGGGSWNGGRGSSRAAADRRGREEAARPLTLREKAIQKRTATGQRDSTANTARGTADRRRWQGPSGLGRSAGVPAAGSGAGQGGERCPQCSAAFGDVGSLVAHVEATHSGRSQAPSAAFGAGAGGEVCPVCNERFSDLALLVSHAESAHPGGRGWESYAEQASKNCSVS
ncbi:unnamed protein product [Ascophyllum nodosum]